MQCADGYHNEDDACVASDAVCSRDTVGRVEFSDRRLLQVVMSGELFVGAGETTNCAVPSATGRSRCPAGKLFDGSVCRADRGDAAGTFVSSLTGSKKTAEMPVCQTYEDRRE